MTKVHKTIPHQIIPNVRASDDSPSVVAREFHNLAQAGVALKVSGQARDMPKSLPSMGYTPKYKIDLFGSRFFLCNRRNSDGLKIMPTYVLPPIESGRRRYLFARIFYKDSSLVWRSASHYINTDDEHWIGKGALRWQDKRGERGWYSAEETTNLPFEIQEALDDVSQRGPRKQNDRRALSLILRNAPSDRISPYRDFAAPRARAATNPDNLINGGKLVARFDDENDPGSLQFEKGFQPDFEKIIDQSESRSSMYGGPITKYRIASQNERIQYLFVAGPAHVWIVNPQSLTTELSSFGLRTIDAIVDEDAVIPGYEFYDNEGSGELDDQIPPGFAGDVCPVDPDRADASPWNEKLPIIREFRRRILRQ